MSLEAWQTELRRQFGRSQSFELKRVGSEPVFADFEVTNPATEGRYRVAIRSAALGDNFCSCPDFLTNALGTCKHIEFTLGVLERRRGGKAALRAGFHPAYSSVSLRYGARRQVRFRRGTDCPAGLVRLAGRHFDRDGILRPEGFADFEVFVAKAARFDHDLRVYDDALAFIAEVRDAERRRERIRKAFPRAARSAAFRDLLRVPLYEYQRVGALFAAAAGRSIIGDEMGLGKTVQAIAAAEIMAGELGVERVLVVCPTSLKHQWEREIGRFCRRRVEVVAGGRAPRERAFSSDSFYKITNYDTVHSDLDLIRRWAPDLVLLDEAQRIKNWKTRTARSVKKIASPYAMVLTGTPLENRLEELVSLVEFVDPNRLGPTFRFLHEHQVLDESGRVVGYQELHRIGKTLAPVLLRRQKAEVLAQLPERLEKHLFVAMTKEQSQHHEENREIVARIVAKWRRHGFLTEADQRCLTIALQRMRMSCDSTFLLDQRSDFGVKADEAATILEEIYEQPDAKAVVFSQWVRMHEVLARRLDARKWGYVRFDGSVPGPQRRALVDRFRDDPGCRTFLATDAGGVGLNLQHASAVLNLDLPWNPAVLEQRIGRVHRLGQRRPVRVVNFVAQGTIEEGMLSLLAFKKSLFAGVLDGGESTVLMGGSRLNRFMTAVDKATQAIPAAAPEAPAPAETSPPPTSRPGDSEDEPRAAGDPTAVHVDPWATLLQSGLAILEQLVSPSRAEGPGHPALPPTGAIVGRDAATGRPYLQLPLPPPEVVTRALDAMSAVLERLRN